MTRVGETPAEELKRLIGEYQDDDAGESTKAEAWNLIADFTVENSAAILRALSPCLDGAEPEAVCDAFDVLSLSEAYGGSGATSVSSKDLSALEKAVKALRASLARKNTGAATPVAYASAGQLMGFEDRPGDEGGVYIPLRKTPCGQFQMPLFSTPAAGELAVKVGLSEVYHIEHDGFEGSVIGSYTTREGKRGVVLQQIGTKVVHVYGEKWLALASPKQGEKA
ncbi:hypothetical protein [Mesorhizobium sp. ORM16]|uniref:hypothetical protein n=1 Tax=Mesorhizobium sp. ORM16 TaxID=3376989 RepID=UPI0038578CD8